MVNAGYIWTNTGWVQTDDQRKIQKGGGDKSILGWVFVSGGINNIYRG